MLYKYALIAYSFFLYDKILIQKLFLDYGVPSLVIFYNLMVP